MSRNYALLRYLADSQPGPAWRQTVREMGLPLLFHYRQSPRPLITKAPGGKVSATDPALEVSGMVYLVTDGEGHLRSFRAVPAELESAPPRRAGAFDWQPAFAEAGLDFGRFKAADPRWIPSDPFDARAEWTGTMPQLPEMPLTVTAAAFRGKLVHFRVLGPWSKPERMEAVSPSRAAGIAKTTLAVTLLAMIVASSLLRPAQPAPGPRRPRRRACALRRSSRLWAPWNTSSTDGWWATWPRGCSAPSCPALASPWPTVRSSGSSTWRSSPTCAGACRSC